MPILCLARHADYRCQDSGACCTSNWPIHVETERVEPIRALAASRLPGPGDEYCEAGDPLVVEDQLPSGAGAVLRTTTSGACVFYDRGGRRCAIHRALGHEALPSACQHFPRRCLIERDSVRVSLSHYCPTVARMAFAERQAGGMVVAPDSLAGYLRLEGLDARDALPPLLRPGMLTDLAGYRAWERAVVDMLEAGAGPEAALARVRAMTERVLSWSPGGIALAEAVERAAVECGITPAPDAISAAGDARLQTLFEIARSAVPDAFRPERMPTGMDEAYSNLVAPAWEGFSRPLGGFLAAHAFGSWCAYLGSGLMTVVRSLDVSLAVVRAEAARLCAGQKRPLDEPLLVEAFRAADLLLVHLADPRALAASVDRS
jgi:Fe-S-cluster containining protein